MVTLVADDPAVDQRVEFGLLSDRRDLVRMRLAAQELLPCWATTRSGGHSHDHPPRARDNIERPYRPGGAECVAQGNGKRLRARRGNVPDGCARRSVGGRRSELPVHRCRGTLRRRCSIISVIPRANIHLTAVMIAERAASFLIDRPRWDTESRRLQPFSSRIATDGGL
jgi:hypothetical protein